MSEQRQQPNQSSGSSQSTQQGTNQNFQQLLQRQIVQAIQPILNDFQQQVSTSVAQEIARAEQSSSGTKSGERAGASGGGQEPLQKVTDTASTIYAWIREMFQRLVEFVRTTLRDLVADASKKAIRAALAPLLRMVLTSLKDRGVEKLESLQGRVQPRSQDGAKPASA